MTRTEQTWRCWFELRIVSGIPFPLPAESQAPNLSAELTALKLMVELSTTQNPESTVTKRAQASRPRPCDPAAGCPFPPPSQRCAMCPRPPPRPEPRTLWQRVGRRISDALWNVAEVVGLVVIGSVFYVVVMPCCWIGAGVVRIW